MKKTPGLSVLVVDDSATTRGLLRLLIARDERFSRIIEAGDAAEGVSLFKVCRPDAVILDLDLPDMSGIEVLRLIKSHARFSVVVVLTSHTEPEIREECLRRGADGFFTKDQSFREIPGILAGLCNLMQDRQSGGQKPSWLDDKRGNGHHDQRPPSPPKS